jgi:hypothetical protein
MASDADDLLDKKLWVLDRTIPIPRDDGNPETVVFFSDADALSDFYTQHKEAQAPKLDYWNQLGNLIGRRVRNGYTHFVLNYGSRNERTGKLIDFLHIFRTGQDPLPFCTEDEV